MRYLSIPVAATTVVLLLTGCVARVVPPRVEVDAPPPEVYVPAPPRAVVSVYVEPPISQPEPIAVGWAPPPLLVESPPPPPFDGAVWVGGYWVWQGDWVWAHGHWVGPPRPNYMWVHPYYEHRDGVVIFITGHWSPPGVAFVPPPPGIHLTVEVAAAGVVAGPRPQGPDGCFIPAPPGSRPGIIIPAPIGTAPAVVTGAPPVVSVGMRVTSNVNNTTIVHNNSVVNNTTNNVTNNVTNVKNVTNITNVTIVAPASATANGQAVNASVPAQAHLAAAQPAVFKAQAPEPASTKPVPAFVHGRPPAPLPPPQAVKAEPFTPTPAHQQANQSHPGNNATHGQPAGAAANPPGAKRNEHEQVPGGNKPADNANKAQVAGNPKGNQPAGTQSKPGEPNGAVAGQPKQKAADHGGPAQGAARHDASKPATPQVAGNKPGDGKHPNAAPAPAKDKSAATAKNKSQGDHQADHPKKPANKDEKPEHG
jgi:hypothetical protein